MTNLINKITKLAMISILAGSLNGKINAQDSTAIKKPRTISIDGWLEVTKGIEQGNNLRLYPSLKIKNFKASSLIDINKFYSFSKNDLTYEKAKLKINNELSLKPIGTLHTKPNETKATLDANLTYASDNYFGYVEVDVNPLDTKQPKFYTYHDFATKFGNFGFFATGKIKDLENTYVEIQFTGKSIKKSGISPYVRANLQKGVKPTYQAGLSINPRKSIKFLNNIKK
ncbi:MAG: hypothetical protein AABY06_02765 [Nanoarchaeota archaeon]|mgnify:CR=1 FL=1